MGTSDLGPTVSCAVLRPVSCAAGVHTSHGPYLSHHAPLRVPHSAAFGRLARPRLLVSASRAGEGLSSLALPEARGPGEPLQELSRSFTDF